MKLSEETLANEKTDTVSFSGVGSSSNILLVDLFYFVNNLKDHTLVTSWYQLQKFGKL